MELKRLIGRRISDRYCIIDTIGHGAMGLVLKAISFDDPSAVVAIKIIQRKNRILGHDDILAFQREASLMSQLHHTNIVEFLELGLLNDSELGSGYYIVMEMAKGITLKQCIERDGPKDIKFFFNLGLQVAEALDYTHSKNIIHRDIKPHNIIMDRATRDSTGIRFKILDFGVAKLSEAMQFTGNDKPAKMREIAGTPLYMAPEQTNLLDEAIDHRVDLYSLGCVLYEVLTGNPPYKAKNREQLERMHVKSFPEPMKKFRDDVPKAVEDIIMKLLSKNPQHRYQTAFSLKSDILRAQRIYNNGTNQTFILGRKDNIETMSSKLPLVGRGEQLEELVKNFQEVQKPNGRSRVSIVSGELGVGKAKILSEFRGYLNKNKIRFLSVKFSKYEHNLPFNAISNAFNDYLIKVIRTQPEEAINLKERFQKVLGDSIYVIAKYIPALKPYLEELEAFSYDETDDLQDFEVFSKVFSDFTRCLCDDNQPVVFVVHDLHWADIKSLKLIDAFFSFNNTQKFYLLFSYDHLTNHREEFKEFVLKLTQLKRRCTTFELNPLNREQIAEFTGLVLNTQQTFESDLYFYLFEQTNGNPLQLFETVKGLVSRDLLLINEHGLWEYDIRQIRENNPVLDSAEVANRKISLLPDSERQLLERAAVLGELFSVVDISFGKVDDYLKNKKIIDDLTKNKILQENELRNSADVSDVNIQYSFMHRSNRRHVYDSINRDRLLNLHLLTARFLQEKHLKSNRGALNDENVFYVCHHYNRAVNDYKTNDIQVARDFIEINVLGAELAAKNHSWQSAQRYLQNAIAMSIQWNEDLRTKIQVLEMQETIADLDVMQRRFSSARKNYREILSQKIPEFVMHRVLAKFVQLQITSGVISETAKFSATLFKRDVSRNKIEDYLGKAKQYYSIMRDLLPTSYRYSDFYHLQKQIYKRMKSGHKFPENSLIKLYMALSTLNRNSNLSESLNYHMHAYNILQKFNADLESLLYVSIDHCAWVARYGFVNLALNYLSLVEKNIFISKNQHIYGYLLLVKAKISNRDVSTLEYGELLSKSQRFLNSEVQRRSFAEASLMAALDKFYQGDIISMSHCLRSMPDLLPTRNRLGAFAVLLALYVDFLSGKRDLTVKKASIYLRRRESVGARRNECYIMAIEALILFASADVTSTKEKILELFIESSKLFSNKLIQSYEYEFLVMFMLNLLDLFEYEFGRKPFRVNESELFYNQICKTVDLNAILFSEIKSLILARAYSQLQNRKKSLQYFQQSLAHQRKSPYTFLKMISMVWFINKDTKSSRSLMNARQIANKLGFDFVINQIDSKLGKSVQTLYHNDMRNVQTFGQPANKWLVEHLSMITNGLANDEQFEGGLKSSLLMLQKEFRCEHIRVVLNHEDHSRMYKIQDQEIIEIHDQDVLHYISPYLNIRSSLYLPTHDAPWTNQALHSETDHERTMLKLKDINDVPQLADTDKTYVFHKPTESDATMATDGTSVANNHLLLSALVPLRSQSGNIGLILAEGVHFDERDSAKCREELDDFGAQVAHYIECKSPQANVVYKSLPVYKPGQFYLEHSPWLNIWQHGRLRATRESTWYLGLNYSENYYLLFYCKIDGTLISREELSSNLWYQIFAIRAQFHAQGEFRLDLESFRKKIAPIFQARFNQHDIHDVSLAFTIFDKRQTYAFSGHFGPTRPIVLGQDNQVKPYDEVICEFMDNRQLRYWETAASIADSSPYLLAFESHKLPVKKQDWAVASINHQRDHHPQQLLESVLNQQRLPRYYVGVSYVQEQKQAPPVGSIKLLKPA